MRAKSLPPMYNEQGQKWCSKGHYAQPSDFFNSRATKDGRMSACKTCMSAIQSNHISRRHKDGICTRCKNPCAFGSGTYCEYHLRAMTTDAWVRKCRAVETLGGSCAWCGQDDVRTLEFDHINNDGKVHRLELGRRGGIADWVIKYPEEAKYRIQVLCGNCHNIKFYKAKETALGFRR